MPSRHSGVASTHRIRPTLIGRFKGRVIRNVSPHTARRAFPRNHRCASRSRCRTVYRDPWVGSVSAFLTSTRTWIRLVQCGTGDHSGPCLTEQTLAWMQAQVGGRVTVSAIRSLHDGESPWWINLRSPDDSSSAVVLRTSSRRIWPDQVATNAAALAVAEKYGLPAPRLLGTNLDGRGNSGDRRGWHEHVAGQRIVRTAPSGWRRDRPSPPLRSRSAIGSAVSASTDRGR
jgi:hypothetical protein